LSPLVGNDATIGFSYRTDGTSSPDHYALWVAWRYLNRQLYENIRVHKALSYSPASAYAALVDYGIFLIATDVNFDNIETAKSLLAQETENIREGRIKVEDIEAAKRQILMERVQSWEANRDIAAYYVQSLPELKTKGKLTSHEEAVARVTPNDVQRAAQKYLRPDRQIAFVTTPTLTYNRFFAGLGLLIVGVPGSGFYLLHRFIKKRGIGK
jgi:predicted Zn-dependent peptidase